MIMEMRRQISTKMEKCGTIGIRKRWCYIKYKKAIIEIVGKICDEKTLKRIYKFVSYLYTHEAGG